jgi:hypothetical protein
LFYEEIAIAIAIRPRLTKYCRGCVPGIPGCVVKNKKKEDSEALDF